MRRKGRDWNKLITDVEYAVLVGLVLWLTAIAAMPPSADAPQAESAKASGPSKP